MSLQSLKLDHFSSPVLQTIVIEQPKTSEKLRSGVGIGLETRIGKFLGLEVESKEEAVRTEGIFKVQRVVRSSLEETAKDVLESMKGEKYFPNEENDIGRLLYLTTSKSWTDKSPFTEQDSITFSANLKAASRASCGLKWAPLSFILFGACSYVNYVPVTETSWSGVTQATVVGTVGAIASIALSEIGRLVTGVCINKASNTANAQQNRVRILENRYDELAYYLIDFYHENPTLASKIANDICLSEIRKVTIQATEDEDSVRIFTLFDDALKYTKAEIPVPRTHLLKWRVEDLRLKV